MTRRDRVLVVENDWQVARDFSRMLERHGFDVVRVASTVEEALAIDLEQQPDICLVDITLRRPMDGITFARTVMASRPIALVFVTGFTDLETLARVKQLGSFALLVKPVSEQQLTSTVDLSLDRFRHEQRLVAERNRAQSDFQSLFDAANDAMLVVDVSGRIVLANAELERRFGYAAGGVIGQGISLLVPSLPGGEAVPRTWFAERTSPVATAEVSRLTARRADGTDLPVDLSLTYIGTGTSMRTLVIIRDGSDRQLFQQMSDERRELAEQVDRAVRIESVGRLAGGVAHDFNNMLTVVLGYTDNLLHKPLDEGARRHLYARIRSMVERASGLTRQLLAFGRQPSQPQLVHVADIIEAMSPFLRSVTGERVQLTVSAGDGGTPARVDPAQIEQVVMNLVLNARDAMPHGGGIHIETSTMEIDEAFRVPHLGAHVPPGSYVALRVRDQGVGMDGDTVRRACEPFFTTKPRGLGSGMGLSSVHSIVKQSAGQLWIDSQVGVGTTVHILVPRAEGLVSRPMPAPTAERRVRGGSGTVLLIEDEPDVRELLADTLSFAGYSVATATNGEEALAAFLAAPASIDLIVTDVVMPHTTGPDMIRAVRATRPDMKVLFISGYAADAVSGEAMVADRLTDFLQKPFGRDTLLQRVGKLLGPATTSEI